MSGDLQPQNLRAEAVLLGLIIREDAVGWAIRTRLQPEDFFDPKHRMVYEACMETLDAGLEPGLPTVVPLLAHRKGFEDIDWAVLLVALVEAAMPGQDAEGYADLVSRAAHRRRMLQAGETGVQMLRVDSGMGDEICSKVAQLWNKAGAAAAGGSLKESGELVAAFRERRQSSTATVRGHSTGFPELDEYDVTLAPGSVTVLAARPSMGKSALANSMIGSLGIKRKVPTLLFTLEVDGTMVTENIVCGVSDTPHSEIRLGGDRLVVAEEAFAESPIYVNDTGLGVDEVRALTRMAVGKWGIEIMVLDYLQLLRRDSRKSSREREVAEQSAMLKDIARENDIAVLVLAQLNRDVESRETKGPGGTKVRGMPRMSDLRESGAIEQDADCILLLHRAAYYENPEHLDTRIPQETSVIVGKNRNGPTGRARLMFYPRCTSFKSGLDLPAGEPNTAMWGGGKTPYLD